MAQNKKKMNASEAIAMIEKHIADCGKAADDPEKNIALDRAVKALKQTVSKYQRIVDENKLPVEVSRKRPADDQSQEYLIFLKCGEVKMSVFDGEDWFVPDEGTYYSRGAVSYWMIPPADFLSKRKYLKH